MTPDDPRHGTNAGYVGHRKRNELACDLCKTGRAIYERRRRYDSELGRPRIVPSIGLQRRVHSLQRMGWSLRAIARECGWSVPQDLYYALHSDTCSRKSWLRVARAYERLCMSSPALTSGSARARNRAVRLGYAPPLAWDDIDNDPAPNLGGIDDEIDPVVVDRLLHLERVVSTRAEKVEAMRRWLASGRSEASLCEALGWKAGRYVEREEGAA